MTGLVGAIALGIMTVLSIRRGSVVGSIVLGAIAAGLLVWYLMTDSVPPQFAFMTPYVTTLLVLSLAGNAVGARIVARKSAAAVAAAQAMAADDTVRSVALSQAWAYGGRLYLGNGVTVHDLGVPPTPEELAAVADQVDRVGVYASDVRNRPELRDALRAAGLTVEQRVARGQSRSVLVFSRPR